MDNNIPPGVVALTQREQQLMQGYEARKDALVKQHAELENQQKAIMLCILDRTGADMSREFQATPDFSHLVPRAQMPSQE